jgi:hypothetical protein
LDLRGTVVNNLMNLGGREILGPSIGGYPQNSSVSHVQAFQARNILADRDFTQTFLSSPFNNDNHHQPQIAENKNKEVLDI